MKIIKLGQRGRVATLVSHRAQGDGADRDTQARAELHDRAEEAIGPAHSIRCDFRKRKRGQGGEFH